MSTRRGASEGSGYRAFFLFLVVIFFLIFLGGLIYGLATDLNFLPLWAKVSVIGVVGVLALTLFMAIAFSRVSNQPQKKITNKRQQNQTAHYSKLENCEIRFRIPIQCHSKIKCR